MALELPGISVKSRVSSFEAQREPRGCGCCSLPDTGDPAHSRRRGCASPAPSRGTSPARAKPGAPGSQSRGRPGAGRRDIDKTLLSLLLIFHSGSGSSMIAIDNKIEQAMDLVKSHLMFAVREEVEVLREQIKELAERNAALEWENGLLRSLASPEQLAQLRRPTA